MDEDWICAGFAATDPRSRNDSGHRRPRRTLDAPSSSKACNPRPRVSTTENVLPLVWRHSSPPDFRTCRPISQVGRRTARPWENPRTVSTAAILIAVLILLVLGDIAVVRAWTRRNATTPAIIPTTARQLLHHERAEDQARQGRSERSVLRTRAIEDAVRAAPSVRSTRSPAVVREGLVGLGHAVDVVLTLVRAALL